MAQDAERMFSAGRVYGHVAASDPLAASIDQDLTLASEDNVDLFVGLGVPVSADCAAGRYFNHVDKINVGVVEPPPNRRSEDLALSSMRYEGGPFAFIETVQSHDVPEAGLALRSNAPAVRRCQAGEWIRE